MRHPLRSIALGIAALVVIGCPRSPKENDASAPPPSPSVVAAPVVTSAASSVTPPPPPAPRGLVTLIVQKVDTQCWDEGTVHESFLGHDVLVEIDKDEAERNDKKAPKPKPDHVFCGRGPTGKVVLNTWEMCRSYKKCIVIGPDAGGDRLELQCDTDQVILGVEGGRTLLKSSAGEREIAPYPMKIAPLRRTVRKALIDC